MPGCALADRVGKPTFCKNILFLPDGYEAADSGWPRGLQRFAAEAWRRVEAGEITEAELYPCDAQWCGLYDRMFPHPAEEMERRLALAPEYGEAA